MPVQTDWLEKDYYDVLGVAETASEKDIQRAYRNLARKHHPDANPDDPGAEERFKAISAAYDVVGEPDKRKEYDEVRRLGPMAGGAGAAAGHGGDGGFGGFTGFRVEDLGDLGDLGDVFGGLFGGRPSSTQPGRGRDIEAELQLTFEQAAFGFTTELRLSGADGMSRPVKVRVPAGVADGQLIRLPGRGGPGRNGGPPGDLFVHALVAPHPVFGREGANLTVTVPVTYPEAVLGAEVKVPTLDGTSVTVRVPAGTPSGRTLRVKGHGVPRPSGGRGDLLVTIEVAVPRQVSQAERAAVEALAEVMEGDPRRHLAA